MRTLHSLHTIDLNDGEIGTTVRNGDKWRDSYDETLLICECLNGTHTIVGEGKVVGLWRGEFKDIPARLIENEREISSRLYSGLLHSMRRGYGPEFTEYNEVIALTYKFYKKLPAFQ